MIRNKNYQVWNGYVKDPKFTIFVNDFLRGKIKAICGIRQDDPRSPFLFLLVEEVLSGHVFKVFP